jgi:hypothetical protein
VPDRQILFWLSIRHGLRELWQKDYSRVSRRSRSGTRGLLYLSCTLSSVRLFPCIKLGIPITIPGTRWQVILIEWIAAGSDDDLPSDVLVNIDPRT